MKKFFAMFALSILAMFFSVGNARAEDVATLEEIQGEVFLRTAGSTPDQWQPAAEKDAVKSGDSVRTGEGSCSLIFGDQATFKVTKNTTFTVQSTSRTQDIWLTLGKLQGKVDKKKVIKPFQVVTPVAIAAVRGTEVDFDFTEEGGFSVDLHDDGPVQLFNEDADMSLDLSGIKKVNVKFNKETGELTITNSCESGGPVSISVAGVTHVLEVCGSQTFIVDLQTAAGETNPPTTNTGNNENGETTPNENAEQPQSSDIPDSISPVT